MKQPPRLAAALLRYLLHSDGLVGDLAEEFAKGRSPIWYWRQVAAAISARAWSDICDHKLATLGAITLGFAFIVAMFRYVIFRLLHFDELLFETGLVPWFYRHGYAFPRGAEWPLTGIMFAASGWIVGRIASQARLGAVVAYIIVTECLWWALGMWRFVYDPIPSHLILAILTVAVRPAPALIAGLSAKTAERECVVE